MLLLSVSTLIKNLCLTATAGFSYSLRFQSGQAKFQTQNANVCDRFARLSSGFSPKAIVFFKPLSPSYS